MFSSNSSQVSSNAVFVEEIFQTYLYTGTGAALTITNNIDLSTKGGLVWLKGRSGATDHKLTDTARGVTKALVSNSTAAQTTDTTGLTAFGTTGFTLGADANYNTSAATYASWTWRKQAKYFDIVTYTGDGSSNRQIAHNLGSAPGCVIVKRTDTSGSWVTYHRGLTSADYAVFLNFTNAQTLETTYWNSTAPTSTNFTVGSSGSTNQSGGSFVAYLFAHDAGGFGLAGTDNVISCGSYTGTGAIGNTITLGYEPQWIMIKASSGTSASYQDWYIYDNMRGIFTDTSTNDPRLMANLSSAESSYPEIAVSATGFVCEATGARLNESGTTYIYIAIRRGPMKVPTLGTSVFSPNLSSSGTGTQITTGFPVDAQISKVTTGGNNQIYDRLRGVTSTTTQSAQYLVTNLTAAELTTTGDVRAWNNTGFQLASGLSGIPVVYWNFGRAPSFFDEVCYTGTGSATTVTHNLAAVPELMILKVRSNTSGWQVYASALANTDYLILNTTAASVNGGSTRWNSTTPTSSVFSIGTHGAVNGSGDTYVAYLFATCSGVSKVGSYSGNTGVTVAVPCGFTSGVRFVLIKRTDSTGDWYVWDSARGIVAGNDPYLLLNSTAAEVTSTDYVDTYSAGFEVTSTAPAALNATGGTYIFLAIA